MRTVKKLLAVLSVAAVLLCCTSVSLAWLTASSAPSVSVFSIGDIALTFTDDAPGDGGSAAVLIPGTTTARDPVVTVKGGSVDCWLFVVVDKAGGAGDCLGWQPAADWILLSGNADADVYYRMVSSSPADQVFHVVGGGVVTVRSDLTRTQINGMAANPPTLTFTACAIQYAGFPGPAAAWAQVANHVS